ncbi:MAG: PulJ/GspJ family protein, partial [Myxococcaceae bacterium]
MRRARGFTLIEVVVAVGITAMIGGLIAVAFQSGYRAKELVEGEADRYRALRTGTDRMVREISGDFRAEGWDAFTWKAQILAPRTTDVSPDKLIDSLFNLPPGKDGISGLAALLGSGRDGGMGGAAGSISSLSSQLTNMLPQGGTSALPPGATQASGLAALGPMAGLAQTQMTQLLQTIQQGVREVHHTIRWQEGTRTES